MAREKETTEIATKKKSSNGGRFKKGMEKAEAVAKRANAKVREMREGGRYGRAVVDTIEAGIGGGIGGALDGFGLAIPIGEEKHYAYFEVTLDEDGNPAGYVDKDGDKALTLADAEKGVETEQMTIPAALPLGIVAVGLGAHFEQADSVEIGKGMVGYGTGRLANDAAKAVRALFR